MCNVSRKHDIYLAGGCFWGVEKYFSCISGVLRTVVGYANGNGVNPTYEQVCKGTTNFVECVHIVYDPSIVSLNFLLNMFYEVVDPTSINKQGNDIGVQYRSGIYYTRKLDVLVIEESLKKLQEKYTEELTVEVSPLKNFYLAEDYHQKYLDAHPNGYCHIPTTKFESAKSAKCCLLHNNEQRFQKRSDEELHHILTDEQYKVTQLSITEHPYKNDYWDEFQEGIYIDITTGEPLFVSNDKFDAGCGWPSFSKPIQRKAIKEKRDQSHGMERIEVRSSLGDAHLGHVFNDGPIEEGGLRYCINSASLTFIPKDKMKEYGYGDYLYLLDK